MSQLKDGAAGPHGLGPVYHIPRSQSTGDLFLIPELDQERERRRRQGAHSLSSISLHERARAPTAYQQLRTQMKQSFQFPNGESFTPRAQLRPGGERAHSLCGARPEAAAWPRRSASLQKPAGRGYAAKAASAESLVRRPREHALREHASPGRAAASAALPAACHVTKSQSCTSIKTLSNPTTSSSSISQSSGSLIRENASGSITSASDISQKTDGQRMEIPDLDADRKPFDTEQEYQGCVTPVVSHRSASEPTPPTPTAAAEQAASDASPKRSNSRLGLFFKKLLPSIKRKPKQQAGVPSTPTHSYASTADSMHRSPLSVAPEPFSESYLDLTEENNDNSSLSSYEREPASLFDIDLVFDTLLLKNDRHDEPKKDGKGSAKEQSRETNPCVVIKHDAPPAAKRTSLTHELDYELIHEFSKLGEYIRTGTEGQDLGATLLSLSSFNNLTPPPRSNRRPVFRQPDVSQSFYHSNMTLSPGFAKGARANNKLSAFQYKDRVLSNLQLHWKVVHVNETMPRQSSPAKSIMSSQPSLELPNSASSRSSSPLGSAKSVKSSKRIEFAEVIYVNDTYSHWEYRRSDKRFLRERKQLMTSAHGLPFVQAVKWELNEYKKHEMMVHPESMQNTQFFV
ncbi:AaceriAGR154Cp [[Ashbya] aceris (nom. inval.)]|nr:AaceriAGR154Cp [[Ashbya] aceris (nom. inval.)]